MRENCYFDLDKFQDIVPCRGNHYKDNYYDYLFLDGKLIDLDVFLNRPAYLDYPNYPLGDKAKCCYFLVLSHAQDLFAYFCSILVSMYLNYAMEHFSELILVVKLSDEKFIISEICNFAYDLLFDFFDTNYFFFL